MNHALCVVCESSPPVYAMLPCFCLVLCPTCAARPSSTVRPSETEGIICVCPSCKSDKRTVLQQIYTPGCDRNKHPNRIYLNSLIDRLTSQLDQELIESSEKERQLRLDLAAQQMDVQVKQDRVERIQESLKRKRPVYSSDPLFQQSEVDSFFD